MFQRTKKGSIAGKTANIEPSIIALLSVLVPVKDESKDGRYHRQRQS